MCLDRLTGDILPGLICSAVIFIAVASTRPGLASLVGRLHQGVVAIILGGL